MEEIFMKVSEGNRKELDMLSIQCLLVTQPCKKSFLFHCKALLGKGMIKLGWTATPTEIKERRTVGNFNRVEPFGGITEQSQRV